MKLAVFDIDGTLVQSYPTEDPCFVAALHSSLGLEGVDSNWATYENVTDSGLLHDVSGRYRGRPPMPSEARRFRAEYTRSFRDSMADEHGAEIAGAAAFLTALRTRMDWRVALATGNFIDIARLKLRRAALPALDVPIATADDGISRASLVRIAIGRAERHFDVASFEHVVSIGDGPWDLSTAREMGVPFLAVGSKCSPPPTRGIIDYRDGAAVLRCLEEAICW